MEEKAKKLNGKTLRYDYNDGSAPFYLKDMMFTSIGSGENHSRFFFVGSLGYGHEVTLSKDTISNLLDKGYNKYAYGTLRLI